MNQSVKCGRIDWMAKCLFPGNVHGFPLFATTVIIKLSSTQTLVTSLSMTNGVGVRGKLTCKLTKQNTQTIFFTCSQGTKFLLSVP